MLRRSSDRLVGVDAARGVALLGMVAVHVLPTEREDGSPSLVDLVAGGRSAALFAVLAGVGVALAYGRRPKLPRSAATLTVRALVIGAIGLALGLLDSGIAVILAYYAVFFLLLLPWLRAGPRLALTSGVLVAVAMPFVSFAVRDELPRRDTASPSFADLAEPGQLASELLLTGYYPALLWLAYLLVGLGVGRLALHRPRTAGLLAAAGAVVALGATAASRLLLGPLGGYEELADVVRPRPGVTVEEVVDAGRFGNVPTDSAWWLATDSAHSSTPLDLLATGGAALLVLGLALLVARRAATLLTPLAAAGGMPLTLYSAHVLLVARTDVDDELRFYLAQVVLGVLAATLWRRYLGRGPLEAAIAALVRPLRPART